MTIRLIASIKGARSAQSPREQERLADLVRAVIRAYCNPQRVDLTVQEFPEE